MQTDLSLERTWSAASSIRDERTFHDALYEWMDSAPWYAISVAVHVFAFFVLSAFPWSHFRDERATVIVAEVTPPPDPVFDDPPLELDDPVELTDPDYVEPEPVVASAAAVEELDAGDPEWTDVASPADVSLDSFVLGIGGPPGGSSKYEGRFGPKRSGRGPRGSRKAVRAGLVWLAAHQNPDGYWDGDGFTAQCGAVGARECGGAGGTTHDVGLTGLALLAFLGDGNTPSFGPFQDVVARSVRWLRAEQDFETGRIGSDVGREYVYDHAIATLALSETYYFTKSPLLKRVVQRAVNFILRSRNAYGAWRYDAPGLGENDTSVTGWMVLALVAARDAGLTVEPEAFAGALAWFDEVTDRATGRVGYDGPNSLSARTPGNRSYPREKGEAMTAVAVLCRILLGERPESSSALERGAALLAARPPVWEPDAFGCDMYYWYYGSYAMYQLGGPRWSAWGRALEEAVVRTQSELGDEAGSWDPVGPWGYVGGRVYSTALMTLALEAYYRYARVLGAR